MRAARRAQAREIGRWARTCGRWLVAVARKIFAALAGLFIESAQRFPGAGRS
jgi:hypothetical protein